MRWENTEKNVVCEMIHYIRNCMQFRDSLIANGEWTTYVKEENDVRFYYRAN